MKGINPETQEEASHTNNFCRRAASSTSPPLLSTLRGVGLGFLGILGTGNSSGASEDHLKCTKKKGGKKTQTKANDRQTIKTGTTKTT